MVAGLRGVFMPAAGGEGPRHGEDAEIGAGDAVSGLLVGLNDPDDAAVYNLTGTGLVFTADYFPPVVDQAYDYGAIAASNALSDVYAMGGTPLMALNLAGFPADMPAAVAAEILRGAAEKVRAAGAVIGGGHTTRSVEPTFGLAVVGTVDPAHLVRKGGVAVGDVVVLTKALGVGVITTAAKNGLATADHVASAVASMSRLNAVAAGIARRVGVRGGTDVTGYGFLGHLLEMAEASGLDFRVRAESVPLLPGALACAREGEGGFPGGAQSNEAFFAPRVRADPELDPLILRLLYAPETSGGLLLAVSPDAVDALLRACRTAGETAWVVGAAVAGNGLVTVTAA